ncbi:MAG: type II toxin-antitoxin system VapC family toxin, partial [Desulfobacteraceae bacterium]|nr:type II toxin-antitoxin system VapC family toxin [Desulfobacteraceae bacterium]
RFWHPADSLYTTDYVLDETFTMLFKRLPPPKAESSLKLILNSLKAGEFYMEWITPERFIRSWKLRQKLRDKLQFSFTDVSSIIIMQELGIRRILTENSYFASADTGFEIIGRER